METDLRIHPVISGMSLRQQWSRKQASQMNKILTLGSNQ